MKLFIQLSLLAVLFTACSSQTPYKPEAIELNNRAIELNKFNKKPDSALILLDQAIALDSSYYVAHLNKASIYSQSKRFNQALAEMSKVMRLKPDYIEGWIAIGMTYDIMGDTIKAVENYKKSLSLFNAKRNDKLDKKQLITLKTNIAFLLVQTGDTVQAKKISKELKTLDPHNPAVDSLINMPRKEFIESLRSRII